MEDFSFGGCTGWEAGVTLMSAAAVAKQAPCRQAGIQAPPETVGGPGTSFSHAF